MAGLYIFGIPIVEDADSKAKRKGQNNKNRADKRDTGVEKKAIKQGGMTDRTELRTAPGATTPLAETIGSVSSGVLGALGLGPDDGGDVDMTPLALAAGGVAVAAVLWSRK